MSRQGLSTGSTVDGKPLRRSSRVRRSRSVEAAAFTRRGSRRFGVRTPCCRLNCTVGLSRFRIARRATTHTTKALGPWKPSMHSAPYDIPRVADHRSNSAARNSRAPGGPLSVSTIGPLSGASVNSKRNHRQHWRSASIVSVMARSVSLDAANVSRYPFSVSSRRSARAARPGSNAARRVLTVSGVSSHTIGSVIVSRVSVAPGDQ
jgi:hypothetical protein